MDPINYILDVQNPIEQAMRGYGMGRADIEQRQVMQEREQAMGLRATAENRAAQEFEMRRAEADRQRAQAEAGQAELMRLMELGESATADDYTRAFIANPAIRQDLSSFKEMLDAPKLETMLRTSQNLYAAAKQGNVDAVRNQLTVQFEAAKNSGDEAMAATYGSALEQLNTNPEMGMNAIATTTGFTILDFKGPDYFEAINEALGVGGDATESFRTLELRAEAAGLVKGTPEYNQFMVAGGKAPEGMAIRTTPEGGVEFVQGAGAATQFREQESKDIIYAARAEGALSALDPVADQLANLGPRLLEYVPLGQGRQFQDPMFQIANNAGLEFLAAILRKDTGAAITAQEIEIYGQTYLPQPGDSREALAQKKEARSRALRALQAPMRPEAAAAVSGAIDEEEPAAASAAPPPSFITNPTVQRLVQENAGVGITAESIWNAMTAEERAKYGR